MMNDVGRPALREGHLQCRHHQLGPEMGGHRPADDAPTPRVDHHREIQESGPGRHVGDVRDPQPIRARRGELAVDEIGLGPRRVVSHRRAARLPTAHALQASASHQAGNALATDVDPLGGEVGMELRWVRSTVLRHRGRSFPPQPWGIHETRSTPPPEKPGRFTPSECARVLKALEVHDLGQQDHGPISFAKLTFSA